MIKLKKFLKVDVDITNDPTVAYKEFAKGTIMELLTIYPSTKFTSGYAAIVRTPEDDIVAVDLEVFENDKSNNLI